MSICTLTDLNPGFGGPWNKLQIILVNGTFIMPQKKSFGKKKILNFMHMFKSAILAEWKNCQNGTFEPVPKLYTPSTLNNSNETHTFMCLGRAGRFGQH